MKTQDALFIACAALLPLATAAQSGIEGRPYASVSGGLSTLNDADAKSADGTLEFDSESDIALAAALGYDFGANFRMETELSYQRNDVDRLNLKGSGMSLKASGEISSTSGLLNGYYDFNNISSVTPFVSAGIGMTKAELKDFGAFSGNRYLYLQDEPDGTAMAYQVGGGLSLALNYNLALDLKYRYFSAVDLKLDDVEFEYSSHNVYGGIRASF
jgi:opacity protein-like surface antigen